MTTATIEFEDIFTVSRNSAAYFFGSDTLLDTAGVNAKRLDYDISGVSASRVGILAEAIASNVIQNSRMVQTVAGTVNNFSTNSGATVSVATGVGKIDGTDGVTLCTDSGSTNSLVSQSYTITDQTKNAVLSCYMAGAPLLGANTGQLPALYASLTGTASAVENAVVDLGRGLVRRAPGQVATNFISNGIEKGPIVDGVQFYRVWMAFTLTNCTSITCSIRPGFLSSTTQTTAQLFDANGNASAASTGQVYTDQMQLEIGTGITRPSSPIITDIGNTATRQPEVFLCSGEKFETNFQKTSSTIVIDATPVSHTSIVDNHLFCMSDGTLNNSILAYRQASTNKAIVEVRKAGVVEASFDLGTWASGTREKLAFTFSSTSFQAAFNGAASAVDSGAIPTGLDRIHLATDNLGEKQWGKTISSFQYEPKVYTESELLAAIA